MRDKRAGTLNGRQWKDYQRQYEENHEGFQDNVPSLSKQLIERANNSSFIYDAGTSINDTYNRYAKEISEMPLTNSEKKQEISTLHTLSENALRMQARSVGAEVAGPARYNVQRGINAANRASEARQAVENHVTRLRERVAQQKRESERNALSTALKNADKTGALSVTVNGVTYRRARRNSKTWRPV